jgi:hypothetical protein
MRFYAATKAEATISFWVGGVPNVFYAFEASRVALNQNIAVLNTLKQQASTGRIQAYPISSRQVEATTINHIHRGTMLHHVATCHSTTIHLKTKIGKHHSQSAGCGPQCAT